MTQNTLSRLKQALLEIADQTEAEVRNSRGDLIAYATDASAYREIPCAIVLPKHRNELNIIVKIASRHALPLIPRGAGTSLAGQVVGKHIILDTSKFLTEIVELNHTGRWVDVEPGVIRNDLNAQLKPFDLFFAPETSTANRATIGGMVGNNSCGANSVKYGSTREHLIEATVILSDGSEHTFKQESPESFELHKLSSNPLLASIYNEASSILASKTNQKLITKNYPHPDIPRRNTGYALDLLLETELFMGSTTPFSWCNLIAGSEGTLCILKQVRLNLEPLPPPYEALICVHFHDLYESLDATLECLPFKPYSVELMDDFILSCTKGSKVHEANRFFIEGDPEALLVIQLFDSDEASLDTRCNSVIDHLKSRQLGYHFPVVKGTNCSRVWDLRKAGLGLLSNIPGDSKPAPVIEDTAVRVADLKAYIMEFNKVLNRYSLSAVHYAHAGSGELHLRPILNLKTEKGQALFETILREVAVLVKKYNGSLSGEHGDGRLRGAFIPTMYGDEIYAFFKRIKSAWDPQNILNPEKIVDTPKMNSHLRYEAGQATMQPATVFNFDKFEGFIRSAELCNGSADCRKTVVTGGTMCPTYMATRDELYTTRARANLIRESMTQAKPEDWFNDSDTQHSLNHCISCKGCLKECPSSVDMTKLKSEYTHHYQLQNGVPFRSRVVANFANTAVWVRNLATFINPFLASPFLSTPIKKLIGFHQDRSIPPFSQRSARKYWKKTYRKPDHSRGKLLLYLDEFTEFQDSDIGIKTISLLTQLNYDVSWIPHPESGRAHFSKGLLNEAKKIAEANITCFKNHVSEHVPLVGIEPSAILGFRDEFPEIVATQLKEDAKQIASHTYTIEEFLAKELDKGHISSSDFTEDHQEILIHSHCHQKALSSEHHVRKLLNTPSGYKARLIASGCCGMAGSFGYEKEHFDLSMKIGNLVLLPAIKKATNSTIIVAAGTSCRHQIKDGASKRAYHPVEVLHKALKTN